MDPIVAQFTSFIADLNTVERRSILALTEITRDALHSQPRAVPSIAAVIINRVLQAPPSAKLPALYLLDSVSKTVGEPYKAYFAPSLPDAFYNAWTLCGPSMHRSLEKLLTTWNGVFPAATLDAIRSRLPPSSAPAAAHPPTTTTTAAAGRKPMAKDPRLAAINTIDGSTLPVAPAVAQPSYAYAQPQQQIQGYPMYPTAQPQYQTGHSLPSIVQSQQLAAIVAAATAAAAPTTTAIAPSVIPLAKEKEIPQSAEFSASKIKEHNPSAIRRLLQITEKTKSSFLDRKFLRRQQRASKASQSRMWYVDLDTWMVSATSGTTQTAGQAQTTQQQQQKRTALEEEAPPGGYSVPVDDEQTQCALSGEMFEQYWDEDHQEWRYKDAKKLSAQEAAGLGLEEGAIVLVTALGSPNNNSIPVDGDGADAGADAKESQGVPAVGVKVKRELDEEQRGEEEKPDVKRVKLEA